MSEVLQGIDPVEPTDAHPSVIEKRTPPTIRRRILQVVRFAVTAGLCAWIISFVDWQLFWEELRTSSLWIIGIVVLLRFGGVVISSEKWRQLLVVHGLQYRLVDLLRWYFVALFLNQFLPTSIGGDGYRIYKTWGNQRGRSYAVLAVFAERLTGLAALALLGCISGLVIYLQTQDTFAGSLAVIVVLGGIAGAVVLWALRRFPVHQILARFRFLSKVLLALDNLARDYRNHTRRLLLVAVMSFLFHINKLIVIWLLLYALGTTVNFLELTVVVAAVDAVGLLPISLGGLGLVEGSFIYAISRYGVGQEIALAVMLLMRVLLIPLSLIGAYFYFMEGRHARTVPANDREESRIEPMLHPSQIQ